MGAIKILERLLISLSVVYIGLQFMQLEFQAAAVRTASMILLTTLYVKKIEKKQNLFYGFLILFTLGDIFDLMSWGYSVYINPQFQKPFYFVGNFIYISAYVALISRIILDMNLLKAIKKFPLQTLLLIILSVFCVYSVSEATQNELTIAEYIMEVVYNTVIIFLMCLALINYMYFDDKKSILLLIGSIFVVFYEVIQLAYYYVADYRTLNLFCSLFFVMAFTFFYLQSFLKYNPPMIYNYDKFDAS